MKRLVWTCGVLAVVGSVALALWPDSAATSGAPVLAAASTPAVPSAPPLDAAARETAVPGGRPVPAGAPADPAAARGAVRSPPSQAELAARAKVAAETLDERHEEHRKRLALQRERSREHAKKRHEEREKKRAELRAHRESLQAMRPPDPNRPPVEIPKLELGPAVIPDPQQQHQPK